MDKLYQIYQKSVSPQARVFVVTILFYLSLFLSANNRTFLVLSFLYLAGLYWCTKNLKLSLFLVFVATLPFAKGRGYQIFLMAKEDVQLRQLFDLVYYFPLYFSGFFLLLLAYLQIRMKIFKKKLEDIKNSHLGITGLFSLYIIASLFSSGYTAFPIVVLLSAVQLLMLLFVMLIPTLMQFDRTQLQKTVLTVLCASVLFQATWAGLQLLKGGPLGKDIEAILPNGEFGIVAAEDASFLRANGTFFEPSILGTFLFSVSTVLLVSGLTQKQVRLRQVLITGSFLGFGAIIFTGSRMLYLLILPTLLFILATHVQNKKAVLSAFVRKNTWRVLVGVTLLLLIATPIVVKRFSSFSEVFSQYGSARYRVQLAEAAIKITEDYPFGRGLSLSHYYFAETFTNTDYIFDPAYPHNIFFQVLAETGLVGVMLFFGFVYLLIRRVPLKKSTYHPFYFGSLCFLLAAQFYPIFLSHTEVLSYFFLFSGLSLYLEKPDNAQK
ncbi:MAG: O-antigen ligase family protein [bacterium]|nr:O-antigen ligase family protein [bacterium]